MFAHIVPTFMFAASSRRRRSYIILVYSWLEAQSNCSSSLKDWTKLRKYSDFWIIFLRPPGTYVTQMFSLWCFYDSLAPEIWKNRAFTTWNSRKLNVPEQQMARSLQRNARAPVWAAFRKTTWVARNSPQTIKLVNLSQLNFLKINK